MLAYVLAIVVAIGSFCFYLTAFFVPEMHRRQDFLWSGLGLFYAVVLWFCAGRITGAVLLGQLVSVALLTGLGWHTLALRRDLTPEPVRTPVTWADLQGWLQNLQQQLNKYLKYGSIWSSIKVLVSNLNSAIAELRNLTAGPRGVEPASDMPPLQRSPAYEFETEAGEGQSVPSEFATVSMRERQTEEANDGPLPEITVDESTATAAPVKATTDSISDIGGSEEAALVSRPANVSSVATPKTSERTAGASDLQAPQPPRQQHNPLTRVREWLGDVAKGFRKPKPQRGLIDIPPRAPSISKSPEVDQAEAAKSPSRSRANRTPRGVIDIPPRPPSIPRPDKTDATETSSTKQKKSSDRPLSKRGVIDIPPRPPSISETSSAEQPPPAAMDNNWANNGDESEETDWPASITRESTNTAAVPEILQAAKETLAPDQKANWPEPETPRADDGDAANAPPVSPQNAESETNWPDDEDTNWPD